VLEWWLIWLILKVNIKRYSMDTVLISVAFEVVVQGLHIHKCLFWNLKLYSMFLFVVWWEKVGTSKLRNVFEYGFGVKWKALVHLFSVTFLPYLVCYKILERGKNVAPLWSSGIRVHSIWASCGVVIQKRNEGKILYFTIINSSVSRDYVCLRR